MLSVLGAFFAGMAVLQAWPGRGFWQGHLRGGPGKLTSMIQSMAQTPQPRFLAGLVRGFASFTAAHGFAVNLFAVLALALPGAALLSGVALMSVGAGRSGPAAPGAGLRLIRIAVPLRVELDRRAIDRDATGPPDVRRRVQQPTLRNDPLGRPCF